MLDAQPQLRLKYSATSSINRQIYTFVLIILVYVGPASVTVAHHKRIKDPMFS